MAQIIRDGGGTAPVELTVAAKLRDRGHHVMLYGPPDVRGHAKAAGFELESLDWPPQLGPRTAEDLLPRMIGASAVWARQLAPRFSHGVDLVVADCAVLGALVAAKASGVACAAILPTVYIADPQRAESNGPTGGDEAAALLGINQARHLLGLPPVRSLTEQLLDVDRLLVLTSRAFELPAVHPPEHVRHVGPQLPQLRQTRRVRLPEGDEPLVLVSLSTTDQGQLDLLQRLLGAIAPLPVRALVTLGHAVEVDQLHPPANAVLERFVPHSAVLPPTARPADGWPRPPSPRIASSTNWRHSQRDTARGQDRTDTSCHTAGTTTVDTGHPDPPSPARKPRPDALFHCQPRCGVRR